MRWPEVRLRSIAHGSGRRQTNEQILLVGKEWQPKPRAETCRFCLVCVFSFLNLFPVKCWNKITPHGRGYRTGACSTCCGDCSKVLNEKICQGERDCKIAASPR